MKKTSALASKTITFSLFILLIVFVSACGSKEVSGENAKVDKAETFKLTFNSSYPAPQIDGEPKNWAVEKFSELIEERTDGQVTTDIFYSNQLAGQTESLDALAKGTIDLQITSPPSWSDVIPEGSLMGLPFWNMGEEHTLHILNDTEVGDLYEDALEDYGVKKLFYWSGMMTSYMSNKPIRSVDDVKGLVMNSDNSLLANFYKRLGAGNANVPFAEVYEALLRGTVDVITYSYTTLDTYNLHEVVDYITMPATNPAVGMVAISTSTWDAMPEDIQKVILETAHEVEKEAAKASQEFSKQSLIFAKENNVEFIEMSDADYNEFVEIAQETAWKEFGEINDRTARMLEVLKEENQKWIVDHDYSIDSLLNEYEINK